MLRLEVIQFLDETNSSLIQRIPPGGSADIKFGAQLIVQENQEAIFFRDGRAMDRFGPGRYTLTTANLPIITRLLTLPWEQSPFQCQVYFIGKQTFLDQKWGTRQPIPLRDAEFGMVRLRSFGKYSFRVTDATVLLNTLVGTQGKYTTAEATSFLRDLVVARLTDLLGTLGLSLLDLPARYDEIASATRAKVAEDFEKYGLELVDFFINAITPPEEVQRAIDARSSMGAVGDLNAFMKFQAAQSMSRLAEQGGASGPMGMGMGAGFGMMLPGMIQQAMAAENTAPATPQPRPASLPKTAAGAGVAAAGVAANLLGTEFGDLVSPAVDPKGLVRSVAQAAGYTLDESADTWQIIVPLKPLRKQRIFVDFSQQDPSGNPIVAFWSVCGPVVQENAMSLLRYNTTMLHGAFAIRELERIPKVVLQANRLADTLDPLSGSRLLAALAWQADKVEQRLVGEEDEN